MAVNPAFIEHNGGRTAVDEDGYVRLGYERIHWRAFSERLRCARIAEQYSAEMGPGPHTYASNIISARILNAR
jgi:hypothetical protein